MSFSINDYLAFSAVNVIQPVKGRRLLVPVPAGVFAAELGMGYPDRQILQQPSGQVSWMVHLLLSSP
ncbi:hypothetical protein D3C81_1830450 [compost metagenome]